jgi:hypothetical protein
MSTTKGYLHLAGVVFRDEADALERRLLGVDGSARPDQARGVSKLDCSLRSVEVVGSDNESCSRGEVGEL